MSALAVFSRSTSKRVEDEKFFSFLKWEIISSESGGYRAVDENFKITNSSEYIHMNNIFFLN